jgi:CRISPR system Cascade subunit CasA
LVEWVGEAGRQADSLFGVYAALSRDEIASFPALRPHQREPWHCFLVQTAAMALIRARIDELPTDELEWRELLIRLTPGWPGGEAWELCIENWSAPALLQPPVASPDNRNDYRTIVATPDALDMLVTSRNHDVKAARMAHASDDDWLFALVTLQTMEGFLGAGNYGISRMNGGFASRMSFGVRPSGSPSTAFRRDVRRLVSAASAAQAGPTSPIACVWNEPWDGVRPLAFAALDPLYVEVCRRVRLERDAAGRLFARTAGSKAARIVAPPAGKTGDPWAPINLKEDKAVTASRATFGYRRFVELLDRSRTARPVLADTHADDQAHGLAIVATALVRGQGKTEGYHRRDVPISHKAQGDFGPEFLDRLGEVSDQRVKEAGEVRGHLRRALLCLVQGGPETVRLDDDAGGRKIEAWLRDYDRRVDRDFFGALLWAEFDREEKPHRRLWREALRDIALDTFDLAVNSAPRTDVTRIRAQAVARNLLEGAVGAYLGKAVDG